MFTVEQSYDLAALTVLCRAARKTVRKKVWRVFRIAIWVIFALGASLLVTLPVRRTWEAGDGKLLLCTAVLLLFLLTEDRLDAWVALRQMVPGTARSVTVFDEDAYTVTTDAAVTKYRYENITALCETQRYFLFFLGRKHGQMFDKQGFLEGKPDAFRVFLEQKTGKTFQTIK